ncbi:capsule biosynthesis protein CapI [Mesobacillus boroniphilus]|nr:capsule biosynthesis protein CapI [Mesobacillus boroniphilus]
MIITKIIDMSVRILVLTIGIVSSIYIAYNVNKSGYELLFMLPLVYGCVFVFFISPILFKKFNMFIAVFSLVTFTRYVILPILIVFSGWYGGRSSVPPAASSYDLALKLMSFELLVVSIVIYFLFKKLSNKNEFSKTIVKLPNNKFVYLLFIFVSFLLLGLSPNALTTFSFIIPSENMMDLGEGSSLETLTTYFLITSKYIIFLLMMSYCYKKYVISSKKKYIWLSFLIVLLNILILFGDNRSDFIITAIVSLFLLYKLYPKQSKIPIIIVIITIIIVTAFITSHRNTVTYTRGDNPMVDITDTLQVYLGGPYNVAIAIETARLFPESSTPINLVYDLLRPAMGFNLILKHVDGFEFTNYLFNYRLFFSDHVSQIMPIIGQGYYYFGFVFSPLLIIGFIILVYYLIKSIQRQNRIELIFFLSIPITRLGFAMGQNAGILINDTTFFLFLNLLVFYLNDKVVLRK